jgi:hypothetical protein
MKAYATSLSISLLLLALAHYLPAQTVDSESTGVDGALNIAGGQGAIDFDPVALGIDTDGDGIFHFTTIQVGEGTTLRLSPRHLPGPVYWLATGAVDIAGSLDLKGQDGQNHNTYTSNGSRYIAEPGAGGYPGGFGDYLHESTSAPTAGSGPGGGGISNEGGGDGTHDYGSIFCVPLIGGSGGGGGIAGNYNGVASGGGGGAGGGAILIASAVSITVGGSIDASGGAGGSGLSYRGKTSAGGAGSGGEIRLVAPTVDVAGDISAGNGRLRIEAYTRNLSGSLSPLPALGTPFQLFLPDTRPSRLLITSVGGELIENPTGSFVTPDALIGTTDAVEIVISTEQIPVGTTVTLVLLEETGIQRSLTGTVSGSLSSGTAVISTTLPSGYTKGYATAVWAP